MKNRKIVLTSILIGIIYLGIETTGLKYHGPNWDETIHFMRGYGILHFFQTGETNYRDIEERKSYYLSDYYSYAYFEQQMSDAVDNKQIVFAGGGHPPLSDTLAAVSNYILYSLLGLLGDTEAFHFYAVFLSASLIAYLFYFVASQYSILAGLITALSFGLYPVFLGESRFNIKDIPEAVFYAFTILFFYKGVTENKCRWIFISSIFFSLALGTKLNIVFVPLILIPWFVIFSTPKISRKKLIPYFKEKKLLLFFSLFYPLLGIVIFVASWPLLWPDLWNRLLTVFYYYRKIGLGFPDYPQFLTFLDFNLYAMQWILYTTPPVTLFLFGVGVFYSLTRGWKEKHKASILIFLWFAIPIIRVTIPNANIYGGIRQIAEYIPAMAILAGIGGAYIVKWLNSNLIKQKKALGLLQALVVLSFIPITLKIISLYPNESIYFNELIGGLKGAQEKNIPGWGNSLGSTYRQGVNWINAHAEPNAKLAFVYELRSNIAPFESRNDIELNNQIRSGFLQEGEYIIGVTHEGTHDDLFHRKYLERFLNPVYEVKVDDVAVLKVWKNDKEHTKTEYRKETQRINNPIISQEKQSLLIDIGRIVRVEKVEIRFNKSNCTFPTNGHLEYSLEGKRWARYEGNFVRNLISLKTKTQPEPGFIQFWFPADNIRFIQLFIEDKNSCLLIYPVSVSITHI